MLPIKFWRNFYIGFAALPTSARIGPAFYILQSLPKTSELVVGDADNIFGMRCPEMVEGSGFQN